MKRTQPDEKIEREVALAYALTRLGAVQLARGRKAEASAVYSESMDLYRRAFAETAPRPGAPYDEKQLQRRIDYMSWVASMLRALERHPEALAADRLILPLRQELAARRPSDWAVLLALVETKADIARAMKGAKAVREARTLVADVRRLAQRFPNVPKIGLSVISRQYDLAIAESDTSDAAAEKAFAGMIESCSVIGKQFPADPDIGWLCGFYREMANALYPGRFAATPDAGKRPIE